MVSDKWHTAVALPQVLWISGAYLISNQLLSTAYLVTIWK